MKIAFVKNTASLQDSNTKAVFGISVFISWVYSKKSVTANGYTLSIYSFNSNIIMNAKNKRTVIYARVSSENDRQDTSRQITDLKKFSEAQSMEIVKIYEEHISGAKKMRSDKF